MTEEHSPLTPDPYLRAALRHAPDAEGAPASPETRAQVLASAHRAAAEPRPVEVGRLGRAGWARRGPSPP
jgi:hypothetical protein